MYAIYGNIYHQYTPFMLAYIPYMNPMGYRQTCLKHRVAMQDTPLTGILCGSEKMDDALLRTLGVLQTLELELQI